MTDRRPARTESVFLVDDDVSVREVLSAELAQAGFTVVEAASGEAALQLVDSGLEFDVLVTDLAMPRMDGIALIRAIGVRRPPLVISLKREISSSSIASAETRSATTNNRCPGAGCNTPLTRSNGTANGSAPDTSWLDTSVRISAKAAEMMAIK